MSAHSDLVVDQAIESLRLAPIDFLDCGDVSGERAYLARARPSYARTAADLERHFTTLEGVRILEIGTYFGAVSLALARMGAVVTAFDLPRYILHGRLQAHLGAAGVSSLAGDLRDARLASADGAFDAVVMCETLEHLNFNPLPILAEVNRVLRQDGLLYLSLPNLASLSNRKRMLLGRSFHNPMEDFFSQLDPTKDFAVGIHWREYTALEIRQLLGRLGFAISRQYFHYSPGDRLLPSLAYRLFPALRPNQTTLALRRERSSLPSRP